MGRTRRQRNCNTPDTCQVDSVGALDLLAGQTAQCEPQVLESNPGSLICDTPAGIQSLQGTNAEPIVLPNLSELADAGQAILIKEPNGRIRCLIPPNGVDFGVPVSEAGSVSMKDLAFVLQNFNVNSIGDVGNCNFSMAVWSKCNDGSTIISLKQMSFADFTITMGNALLADSDFISQLDETVLSCTNTATQTTMTSLFGCFNGAKGQILPGSGARELLGYNGTFQTVPRGMTFYPYNGNIVAVSGGAQNVTYTAPSPPWPTLIPNGTVYGAFQTEVNISTLGGKADVSLNGIRLNHTEAPAGAAAASYQFMIAPVGQSMTFNITTPNSADFITIVKLMGLIY